MIPKTIVLLLSGGLDSVTALYELKAQGHLIHCLSVNYQQPHVQELELAKMHCQRLGVLFTVIELPALGGLNKESWIVPNRNAILLSLAVNLAVQAKADTVVIGCNADDEAAFPDCRQSFLQYYNWMLKAAQIPVEVCAPYLDKKKWEIVDLARQLGVKMNEIWTCYQPKDGKPCGACPACEKLKLALA